MDSSSDQGAVYSTLTGRRFDLAQLDPSERQFLTKVATLFQRVQGWEEFSRAWIAAGRATLWKDRAIPVGSPVYRICQDLATRLGEAEGRVASPDYRDQLADLIEERFESRYRFCKEAGVDPGHLSRVLAGEKHFSAAALARILDVLGMQLALVERPRSPQGGPHLRVLLGDAGQETVPATDSAAA